MEIAKLRYGRRPFRFQHSRKFVKSWEEISYINFLTSLLFWDNVLVMNILGIETSTATGSVAIMSEDGLVAQYTLNIEITHSERLMAAVDRVLSDLRFSLRDIDGFAVSIGPGSFTGLRVGLSTVKGLSFAARKPVAAVPTLRGLAWNLACSAYPVCPMLDARKKQVYAAIFRYEGTALFQEKPETAISLPDLFKMISVKTVFTGEAAFIYRKEIENALGGLAVFAPHALSRPSAASIAELGLEMITKGELADIDGLAPMYIRRPEAEVAWEKRTGSR